MARFSLEHARGILPQHNSSLLSLLSVFSVRSGTDSVVSAWQSHHKPREGPFEMNDVFAIINAVPAISLMAYGFFHKGLVPGLCFGAVSHSSL